jgi:hypothetical protein
MMTASPVHGRKLLDSAKYLNQIQVANSSYLHPQSLLLNMINTDNSILIIRYYTCKESNTKYTVSMDNTKTSPSLYPHEFQVLIDLHVFIL